jgi:hypothetical protein
MWGFSTKFASRHAYEAMNSEAAPKLLGGKKLSITGLEYTLNE